MSDPSVPSHRTVVQVPSTSRWRPALLLVLDALLLVLALANLEALRTAAALPPPYAAPHLSLGDLPTPATQRQRVLAFEGWTLSDPAVLPFLLSKHRAGDTVTISATTASPAAAAPSTAPPKTDAQAAAPAEQRIVLAARFPLADLVSTFVIGCVFLVFGAYVLVRHRDHPWTLVLHALAASTAAMILFDWGTQIGHAPWLTLILRLIFDVSIWILPALFLHFSTLYPVALVRHRRMLLAPFYIVSSLGIAFSILSLVPMYSLDADSLTLEYNLVHATINDIYLIIGLLAAAALFERTALSISDPLQRRRVYWILLGILCGPLVYVFLILIPRTLLGYELVSNTLMEYTLLAAPILFWISLRTAHTSSDSRGPLTS